MTDRPLIFSGPMVRVFAALSFSVHPHNIDALEAA